jgi:hypothetical protein
MVEIALSMLDASGLPKELWAETCNTSVYILYHTGPTHVEDKTPLELWTGSYAALGHLRVLGQNVMCTFADRKSTSGTKGIVWDEWSVIWVKRMAIEFGYLPKDRLC